MWYILFKAVITVLVIYALVNIVTNFFVCFFSHEPYNNKDVFIVVKVRNQEKHIEGIIRSIIWQNLKLNKGGYIPNILIVDCGSDDETRIIAEKLSEQYSFIFCTTEEDFIKMKNAF